jgi:hypothetical protein
MKLFNFSGFFGNGYDRYSPVSGRKIEVFRGICLDRCHLEAVINDGREVNWFAKQITCHFPFY